MAYKKKFTREYFGMVSTVMYKPDPSAFQRAFPIQNNRVRSHKRRNNGKVVNSRPIIQTTVKKPVLVKVRAAYHGITVKTDLSGKMYREAFSYTVIKPKQVKHKLMQL